MLSKRLIKSNNAGAGACTNTVDLYNPFPDGGGLALYQLNGDATDVSGNYNGTATDVTYGTGQFGQAGVFNGSSSYVSTGIPIDSYSERSYSFWFKQNLNTGNSRIFGGVDGAATNGGMFRIREDDGSINYYSIDNTTYTWAVALTNDVWTFISLTDNGNNVKLYVNGFEITNVSTSGYTTVTNTNLQIGRGMLNTGSIGNYTNGSIDQVRIFSRALRPYEVEALYTEEYCTPTIVPSEHFNTVTYDGQATDKQVTSVGFQPDLVWVKCRDVVNSHVLADSVRGGNGTTYYSLFSDLTNAESSSNQIKSLDLDGFTIWGDRSATNRLNQTYVAWNFKAGGAAVTNTDGTITSQVSANTESGFSIVKFNPGFVSSGQSGTVGHGLSSTPKIIITKSLDTTINWWSAIDGITGNQDDYIALNLTNPKANLGTSAPFGRATSSNFTISYAFTSTSSNMIAYCFAEVEGFSNFGSYVGTGASGNAIVTGFEPAFVMVKQTTAARNWYIMDNKRNPENPKNNLLIPNSSDSEFSGSGDVYIDFLENGFEITSSAGDAINQSGQSYIYMAFAADPTAVEPTLEDSFNTVLYSGNSSSSHSITGVGFQPDLTWIKNRSANAAQWITDSVRGAGKGLQGQSTDAELTSLPELMSSFNSDGFTVGYISNPTTNLSGNNYVAWNWKGAEIPAINSNGSITSVVSANPAAGFSIVSLTIPNANTQSIGHGLDTAPSVIIMKARNAAESWLVYHSSVGLNKYLLLNSTAAEANYTGIWSDVNSSTFTTVYHDAIGSPTRDVIAYCFAEVAGFSKFGGWTGGATSVVTGFEPAFVMVKDYTLGGGWNIFDNKRSGKVLLAQNSNAESSSTFITFNSNGFTFPAESPTVSRIYMAFANQF